MRRWVWQQEWLRINVSIGNRLNDKEIRDFNEEYGIVEVIDNNKVLYYANLGVAHASIVCPKCGHRPALCKEYGFFELSNFVYSDDHKAVATFFGQLIASGLEEEVHKLVVIYGEGMCGRTHLAQAICNKARETDQTNKSLCVSAEDFCNEVAEAERFDEVDKLVARYGEYKYLVIDDMDHLGGRYKSQNLLFRVLTIREILGENLTVLTTATKPAEWPEDEFVERLKFWAVRADSYRLNPIDAPQKIVRKPDWQCSCTKCHYRWKLFRY